MFEMTMSSSLGVKGLIMYSLRLLTTTKDKVGYVFISLGKTLQHSCEWLKDVLTWITDNNDIIRVTDVIQGPSRLNHTGEV